LTAAQSEVEGLKQIYTDNNVRVRQAQARVDELRRQLGRIGGKPGGQAAPNGGDLESTYPAIRQLPVLGVTYADLYRGTKVEEAVFESLTQQYELAKVEEAKETPSVKVLDPAETPEKKSFPPRLLIMTLGAALAFAVGVAFVFGRAEWKSTASDDPGKAFAQEVLATVKASLPRLSSNGAGDGNNAASRKENKPSGSSDA
jgi:capsule polysaccharide export protein KpsE/RkpR